MSSGGWGWARPVVPGCASLLACLVLTPSNVVMKAAITTTASATAKIATAVRRLFRSLFMPSLLRQRWMAGVVPLVVWLHTLPHNILTDPAECHAWPSAPWDEASKLQRPLPDGVLKIVASGEPMDGDAGVSTPLRSPSASATRTILIGRNGAAASIRDRVGVNISPTPPRPSTKPAPISSTHGRRSCRSAPRPIFRRGAIREIGPRGNMRFGTPASGLSRPAMDRASRAVVLGGALRQGIRHARPRGGAGACASHLGGRTRLKRKPSRVPSSLRLRVVASHHHSPSLSSRVA
jgi:hypothetical protein